MLQKINIAVMAMAAWLKSWFVAASVSRELSAMDRRLSRIDRDRRRAIAQLKKHQKILQRLHDDYMHAWSSRWEDATAEIHRTDELIRQYESTVSALREQVQIRDDITIPNLLGSMRVVKSQLETQISIENMRQHAIADDIIKRRDTA